MKEIGRLGCEAPSQPVTVVSMVSFLGVWETTYFVLMVLFPFIICVSQLAFILYNSHAKQTLLCSCVTK